MNGKTFSVVNDSDLKSMDLVYVLLLEIQTIVRCNMLDKLFELYKNDLVSTIVESENPKIMISNAPAF